MIAAIIWYLAIFIAGAAFMPVGNRIFRRFSDRGFIFSKTAGILLFAFIAWLLNVLHMIRFTRAACIFAVIIPAAVITLVLMLDRRTGRRSSHIPSSDRRTGRRSAHIPSSAGAADIKLIITEEIIFAVLFFVWVYIIGFRSEAYGTEKFMDLGFINSMLRSEYMPFSDMWMSGHKVNYYYGGQFITAFLIRLTGVSSGEGYSLMRAFIASASFCLPFSLIVNLVLSEKRNTPGRTGGTNAAGLNFAGRPSAFIAGALSGLAVAFCGTFHYVIYGLILPLQCRISGNTEYSYWFPDTTRFIGYDPDLPDKTIHEFPAYSTILGDLHAHYINILFSVTVIAAAAAYFINRSGRKKAAVTVNADRIQGSISELLPDILSAEVFFIGFMTGLFRWINYWDLPICFVVCLSVMFTSNVRRRGMLPGTILTVLQGLLVYVVGSAASLPFSVLYENDYMNIGFTHSHTLFRQLLIVWGFPVAVCAVYVILMFVRYKKKIFVRASEAGLIIVVFAICGAGLVLLPELVYVKDIYGEDFYRANTMFKLTYQAFILFGISMGYILTKGLLSRRRKSAAAIKAASVAGIVLLIITAGYSITGIKDWFGNIFAVGERGSINASCYMWQEYPEDEYAVRFILDEIVGGKKDNGTLHALPGNIDGSNAGKGARDHEGGLFGNEITGNTKPLNKKELPVILEATGSSYDESGRVSVYTGIPTVLGWHGHEQLWRGDSEEVSDRWYNIGNIYSGKDPEKIKTLLDIYDVDYVYVGGEEKEKYEVDDSVMRAVGEVVYEDEFVYIVKVEY